jgi:hypothetical protein
MMTIPDYRAAAALIILLGCAAALVAALVPFYTVGYKVDAIALAAVLTPFVIYGMFIQDLRGPWLLASGVVLLGATLAVVIDQRVLNYDGYRDATHYWMPLLALALAIALPIARIFGKRPPYS